MLDVHERQLFRNLSPCHFCEVIIWSLSWFQLSHSIMINSVRRRSIKRSRKVSVLILYMNVTFLICWLPYGLLAVLRFVYGKRLAPVAAFEKCPASKVTLLPRRRSMILYILILQCCVNT